MVRGGQGSTGGMLELISGESAESSGGAIVLSVSDGVLDVGGDVTVTAGLTEGAGSGGTVNISAGVGSASGTGLGGAMEIIGGLSQYASGGAVSVRSGKGDVSSSGDVQVATANSGPSGVSGKIDFSTGTTSAGNSGSFTLVTGHASKGRGGTFSFEVGSGTSGAAEMPLLLLVEQLPAIGWRHHDDRRRSVHCRRQRIRMHELFGRRWRFQHALWSRLNWR